ncbi:MAG TPA: bifunctional 2-polyprenyl-6-hydroxyphenol methylase/3-demethylubiquinol 3-O-methyltransferase UbiG [Rhizomicrobium sp.]|nr:bifunctional 2-polyprenyl-6-hydroxyphenol methylase/3-demethylubiquinol 3-O-methyltransferase UbiG [Rhizomicrobium sp.]
MNAVSSSIDEAEVEKFARLAVEWWDPKGSFAPLHRFNPIRLRFIRDVAADHFGRNTQEQSPFRSLSMLDLGCGGGLLSEPLSRLGFEVLGADAAERNVEIASAHAARTGAPAFYRCATAETLREEGLAFDVVLAMEIVEHVPDVLHFITECASLVRPGGILFVATLNRTLKSLALAKLAAEYVLRWVPPGTHDWNRFIRPERLQAHLTDAGLNILRVQGMAFDPLAWDWRLSRDTDVNYVIVAGQEGNR